MKNGLMILAGLWIAAMTSSCSNPAEARARVRHAAEPPKKETAGKSGVTVLRKWDLPPALQEISGTVWEDATHLACINDEEGIIYRYDIAAGAISSQIQFGGPGDYEDLTKVGDTYYVMRSDARLFEVKPQAGAKPAVREYPISIAKKEEIETLFYDPRGSRLLFMNKTGGKKKEESGLDIYAFDLTTKTLSEQPVITINTAGIAAGNEGRKGKRPRLNIMPSALALHPTTGDFYIVDGPHAGLLLASADGKATQYIPLDKKVFPQPEGISFSPTGEAFLSSEGGKGAGILARVVF